MKYKFIGEDDQMFRIQHPDGSEFSIAKNAVGPGVHKKIKDLEPFKMADGGEVPDEEVNLDLNPDLPSNMVGPSQIELNSEKNKEKERSEPAPEMPSGSPFSGRFLGTDELKNIAKQRLDKEELKNTSILPEQSPQSQAPNVVPSQNPLDIGAMNDAYAKSFAQKESGITEAANAQAKASQEQSKAYANQADQIAKQQAHYEQEHAKLDVEHKQLVDAMMNDKIDANRLYHNMGTGNKILAAVSVALSGLGSGLSGQPNMAMGVIQKSIDRDIEAQRMELGKKNTLLSENVRRYGDLNTATQATMLQMNAMTQAKVSQAAAQSGSAQAQANAKVMLGDLGLQAAQLKQQMAIKNMAMQGGSYDPSVLVPHIVPKEHQKAVFDEIERAQDTRHMGQSILKSFDEAAKENTFLKTGAGIFRTPPGVLALHQSMQPTFKDLEGTVRQAAMDNTFKNITPRPGDMPDTIKVKRAALEDYLKSKMSAPTAKGFGIDLDKFGSTTTQSGPEIKTMGGVQYKKVSGGWQKI